MAHQVEDRIRLADLSRAFGDRAFGALLLVFALPNLLPLPPGSSTVLGIPLMLISVQLALERTELWPPRAVGERSLGKGDLQRIVAYGSGRYAALSAYSPRVGAFSLAIAGSGQPASFLRSFWCCPFPRNGLAVVVGWAATLASLAIVALVSGTILYMAKAAYEAAAGFLGS